MQRMLSLARDLPALGWDVDVLTVCTSALPDTTVLRADEIPPGTRVIRSFALDSARHLAIFGKYPRFLSLPDRWATWRVAGVIDGLRYIRTTRPDVVMSSFPIATAHLIAGDLSRLTAVPWLADFRDPMAQDDYPKNAAEWRGFRRVEKRVVDTAAALTFTTHSALAYYERRYGACLNGRCHVVANGYEEDTFAQLERQAAPAARTSRLSFLHSGLLYPWERDPLPFFRALKQLDDSGFWQRHPSRFVFRASGHDEHFAPVVAQMGLQHLVEFLPRVDYRLALREILDADALLLFQAGNSNFQIPAKAYEYLRAGPPILAVVDPAGDTADLLRPFPNALIARLDSEAALRDALLEFVPRVAARQYAPPPREQIALYARSEAARRLAAILETCVRPATR